MAIAQRHIAAVYSKPKFETLFDHKVYCTVGDGCLQEGVCYESMSLAGTLQLGNLIVIYDSNKITSDGSTQLSFTEDVRKRMESSEWHVQEVLDGDADLAGIDEALANAIKDPRPSFIIVHTTIGCGLPYEVFYFYF